MTRNTRTLLVLVVSVFVAGGATMLVYGAVQRIPVREVEVKSYYVAVASKSLPVGTMLTPSDVKLVPWPASSPVAGGYTALEEVTNRGLIAPVVENEPLTSSKLAAPEAGAGLPPTIPAGMRAISVKVNEVIGVAGFVVPGTRVDVVVTLGQRAGEQTSLSRVVVSNVQVLTAGTKYDQELAKDGKPVPTTVVTLMVTPEDAERIALASAEGSIMLTLRNPLDVEPTKTQGIRLASLMGAPEPPPVAKVSQGIKRVERPVVAAPAPSVYSVETIRAAKRTQEVVK